MDKNKNIRTVSDRKRKKRRLKFNFGVLLIIFILSFSACFALYMLAANMNENFFEDEFNSIIVEEESEDEQEETTQADETEVSETAEEPVEKTPVTNPVPQSAAADYATYFDNCCLITDSTLLDIKEHTSFTDVIGDSLLNAANCTVAKVDSNYGTVTIYDTLKLKKPENVYIMLGSDIGVSATEDMIASYTTLIENLTAVLPDMNIYIMQIPPVITDSAPVTNELINSYNEQLLAMANSQNVHCIDTSTALKSVDGNLKEEYWSAEDKKFTADMYKAVVEYILTHVA
ncbi:MAG: hypothetical protein J6B74_05470 [Ruminococcus sp.]|nr:hypothetical protein [Ruminococcus sp.]